MMRDVVPSPIGEVEVTLAGRQVRLKLGGRELMKIQQAFPGESPFDLLPRILGDGDFASIFQVMAIAAQRSWPDVTADMVADAADDCGLEYIAASLMQAVQAAFPNAAAGDADPNPPAAAV